MIDPALGVQCWSLQSSTGSLYFLVICCDILIYATTYMYIVIYVDIAADLEALGADSLTFSLSVGPSSNTGYVLTTQR